MARILLENVTKVFDRNITAVSNFNLDVTDGEFMVIVGPSGCGKTTTLRIIAGLEEATSGNIYIGGDLSIMFLRETGTLLWFSKTTPCILT